MKGKAAVFTVVCAALAIAPALVLSEEEPGESPMRGERFLERLTDALELKGAQKEKIQKIVEKAQSKDEKKVAELKKLRKRMQALGKELKRANQVMREAIREQLDLDQKERFDAMMQEMRRGRGRGRRGGQRRMRGIDVNPDELPPEMRDRMRGGGRQFPPEMWHPGGREDRGREDLPPEIRERIRERMEMRRRQGEGVQRDVPPPEEWHDRQGE
jgi:hypothetical protein